MREQLVSLLISGNFCCSGSDVGVGHGCAPIISESFPRSLEENARHNGRQSERSEYESERSEAMRLQSAPRQRDCAVIALAALWQGPTQHGCRSMVCLRALGSGG